MSRFGRPFLFPFFTDIPLFLSSASALDGDTQEPSSIPVLLLSHGSKVLAFQLSGNKRTSASSLFTHPALSCSISSPLYACPHLLRGRRSVFPKKLLNFSLSLSLSPPSLLTVHYLSLAQSLHMPSFLSLSLSFRITSPATSSFLCHVTQAQAEIGRPKTLYCERSK